MTFPLATEIDPNTVRPGWVALLIVLALGAATVLLWRNMGKQLKKIDFDPDAGAGDQARSADQPDAGSSDASTAAATPKTTADALKTTDLPKAPADDPEHTNH